MKTLYLDCFCGASGDMLVGALIDAGAPFDAIRQAMASLGVHGYELAVEKVNKHGIVATKFHVHVDAHHDHPHRYLRHVLAIIDSGDLPEPVKQAATETFRRIAECEAAVHDTTPEKVHFHEVGAVDSIVDIVGAHLARHLLVIERVVASPLHLGSGTVTCAHGVMPVPTPATAMLVKDVPAYSTDVEGELTTPTGAALVSHWADAFGPMPLMRVKAIGYGAGVRDLPDRANVLRALVGDVAEATPASQPVVVIEANVDDMTPEMLAPLPADFIQAGALDAFLTPIVGKKGRPGHLIVVLCDRPKLHAVADLFFRCSTTLGVRIREEERICLERTWRTVPTPWGEVRVKSGAYEGRPCRPAPEFEDCRSIAEQVGVPVLSVYERALAAALQDAMQDAEA